MRRVIKAAASSCREPPRPSRPSAATACASGRRRTCLGEASTSSASCEHAVGKLSTSSAAISSRQTTIHRCNHGRRDFSATFQATFGTQAAFRQGASRMKPSQSVGGSRKSALAPQRDGDRCIDTTGKTSDLMLSIAAPVNVDRAAKPNNAAGIRALPAGRVSRTRPAW